MNPELPLRDIHLPAPIGWWPPAPGWWGLLVLAILSAGLAVWVWRRWRRVTARKLVLRELEGLSRSQTSPREKLSALAVLLRRACLSAYPRTEVAGLTGEAWLEFLDRQLGDRRFREGPGRQLLDAPYRRAGEVDIEALLGLCREWARRLPAGTIPGKARRP